METMRAVNDHFPLCFKSKKFGQWRSSLLSGWKLPSFSPNFCSSNSKQPPRRQNYNKNKQLIHTTGTSSPRMSTSKRFTDKQHRLGGGAEQNTTRYDHLKYLNIDDGKTWQQKDNSCSESQGNITNYSIFYHMLNYRKHHRQHKYWQDMRNKSISNNLLS